MEFRDVIDLALNRVGEDPTDADPEELPIIKSAINQAYFILRSSVDQRTDILTKAFELPIVLPSFVGDIVDIVHERAGRLGVNEYTKAADLLYVFSPVKNGELSIFYIVLPEKLVNDTDTVDLNGLFIPALSTYAAYSYQLYRRKYASAQMLLGEFESYTGQRTPMVTQEE